MSYHKMPQIATFEDQLSATQEKVLMALLAGKTVSAAAQEANVDRSTVYRWLRHPDHRGFSTALQRGRRELRQAMSARLLALLPKAIDGLEAALTAGDSKSAVALLKGLGFLR